MKILAIESSTKYLGLAVVGDDKLIAEYTTLLERNISKFLHLKIKELLSDAGLSIDGIDAIAVSIGPGSFTGLRVGVTAAKGIAIAAEKPLVGVPTLDALAQNAGYFSGQVCALVDAKKNMVYSAVFESKDGKVLRKRKPAVEPLDAALEKTKGQHGCTSKTLFLGDAIGIYRKEILEEKGKDALFAPDNLWYPRAGAVGLLGSAMIKKGPCGDPYELAPMYLHPRTCTIKR